MAEQFPKIFYVHRKRGKSSPKSLMFYPKTGPRFSSLTPQQKRVRDAGKKCGSLIRGAFPGSSNVKNRRTAMGACIRKEFGKSLSSKEQSLLNQASSK